MMYKYLPNCSASHGSGYAGPLLIYLHWFFQADYTIMVIMREINSEGLTYNTT